MVKQKSSVVLACFSPPVMVASFVVEAALGIYVLVRYKLEAKGRTILALLTSLAAFQLAEYFVCTQSSIAIGAARAGYVAITFLPALGLYLTTLLTRPLTRRMVITMFACTSLIAGYFLLAPQAFDSYECTGNYVIFQIGWGQVYAYSVFYFGLIFLSIWRAATFLRAKPMAPNARSVRWLLAGFALFIIPVAILTVLQPDTRYALPSLMCGFAITFAVILATRIAPLSLLKRKT